jgi:hypothetical protein
MTESIQASVYRAGFANKKNTTNDEPHGLIEHYAEHVTNAFNEGDGFESLFESFCDQHDLSEDQMAELAERTFNWLLESLAVFVENLERDEGHIVDLERAFELFAAKHDLSEDAADMFAEKITEAAGADDDDDDDAITFPDETSRLSNAARLAKIRLFLKSIARRITDGHMTQPLFPNLRVGDKKDPYGNRAVGNVKTFDRQKNNFGHTRQTNNEQVGHGFNPLSESLACPSAPDAMDRYVDGLDRLNRLWTSSIDYSGPAADFRAANKQDSN